MKGPLHYILYFLVLVVVIAVGRYAFAPECYTVRERVPAEGTQGYQTWYGEDVQSFYHRNRVMCIPDGWRAIGAIETGDGWARYERGKTGVMLREEAFLSRTLTFETSNYAVTLLYPAATSKAALAEYERIVENAFNRVGALFNDAPTQSPRPHTVLVTAGLGGAHPEAPLIYPDPRESVTVFVRSPYDTRAEELLIHAVVHLYNRFRTDFTGYQKNQSPLQAADFQELEATWAETAFRSSSAGRESRLAYLYTVHTAVKTGNFDLVTGPPFDNKQEFENITPSVVVPRDASELDIQYGHYVLAPLSLVAVDELLYEAGAPATVEKILTKIHAGEADNLFEELARYFNDEKLNTIWRWMDGQETIPQKLIQTASSRY